MAKRESSVSPDGTETPEERTEPLVTFREATIELEQLTEERAAKGDSASITIALSSETPVERYDWWEGERYLEVLDHDPASVDLSYARDGLPLLLDHDTREHIGIVENVRVEKDRVIRGDVRFSKGARAQEVRQDVLDGIRKKVSVGYMKDEKNMVVERAEKDAIATRRYKRWRPMEGSMVAIPADYSVGVGRSAGRAAPRKEERIPETPTAPKAKEITMSDKDTAAQSGAGKEVLVQDRGEQVIELCELAGVPEKAGEFLRSGKSVTEIRAALREEKAKNAAKPVVAPAPTAEDYREKGKRFSLSRAMHAATSGDWKEAGYERAVSQAEEKRIGKRIGGNTFYMPTVERLSDEEIEKRTALTAGTDANGGYSVFEEYGGFIDLLRNRSAVMSLGATVLPGLQGDVALPRQITAGTAYWMGESSGTDVTESNVTFDKVVLSPKILMARQRYSNQLLAQSAINVDALIRSDLAAILALEIDRVAIHGTGASNQPLGIYPATGVNTVAFGGAISYVLATKMEEAIEVDNADIGAMAFLTTPEVKQDAKTTQVFSGTNGAPLWIGGASDGEMAGYRAVASNQVSKVMLSTAATGGTSHGLVFGVWPQLLIGEWGSLAITVDNLTLAGQDDVRIIVRQFVDVDVKQPTAFAVATGLTATA